jgi:hypothetical protein
VFIEWRGWVYEIFEQMVAEEPGSSLKKEVEAKGKDSADNS